MPRLKPGRSSGFALPIVLWATVLLSAVILSTSTRLHYWGKAAENRILLARAFWAQEACLAQLRAEYSAGDPDLALDTVLLGNATWCAAYDLDPSVRVNLNVADSASLVTLLGPLAAIALLDWRDTDAIPRDGGVEREWYAEHGRPPPRNGPLVHESELLRVRGVDDRLYGEVKDLITVRGDGRIDANRASPRVLRTIPILSEDVLVRVLALRSGNRAIRGFESLLGQINEGGELGIIPDLAYLQQRIRFAPDLRVVEIRGGVRRGEGSIESRMIVSLRDRGGQLEVLAREVE